MLVSVGIWRGMTKSLRRKVFSGRVQWAIYAHVNVLGVVAKIRPTALKLKNYSFF